MRQLYRILRSILVSAVMLFAGIWLLLYILLSTPAVQEQLCNIARRELSQLLGTDVEIGSIGIAPFNSAVVKNLRVKDLQGRHLLEVEKVGAGINLWKLITRHRLDFTHAELIGLNANIIKDCEDCPYNLQFIIDALKSKEKKREAYAVRLFNSPCSDKKKCGQSR